MKELLNGLIIMIMALLVSILMYSIGILYSLGYSIWLTITLKKFNAFFLFWWRLVDGLAASIGHVLYQIGVALDISWNVNGEILEDMVTSEENTTFSNKNITVSASVGKLQLDNKLNKFGIKFSKFLNRVFNQKHHAVDSWNYYVEKERLEDKYFN